MLRVNKHPARLFSLRHIVQHALVACVLIATFSDIAGLVDARRSTSPRTRSSRDYKSSSSSRSGSLSKSKYESGVNRTQPVSVTTPPTVVPIIDKYGNVSEEDYGDTTVPLPCSGQGYLKHPQDCSRFYRCDKADEKEQAIQRVQYVCPSGLVFDEEHEVCNWPSWSPSCQGSGEILKAAKKKFTCPSYGYFQDPNDCAYFYYCSDFGKSTLQPYEFKCPFDLAFDEEKLLCNWKWLVKGCSEAVSGPDGADGQYPRLLDGTDKNDDANQDIDEDRDDDTLERRSDDAEDVEFVDTPAEHRGSADRGSYSFTKTEGGSRRGFGRSIKDAVSGAIGSVKNILGMQGEPDKRQDIMDPTLIAEESILSNWFTAMNPFGYANQLAQNVAKTIAPSRPPKKGEQFISIPIISVVPDEPPMPGQPPRRPPGPPQHRPEVDRRPEHGRFPPQGHQHAHPHRGQPVHVEGHRPHREHGRPSVRPSGAPRNTMRPSHGPVTGRPKKQKQPQQQPELIPVPILTVRETPRPGHHQHPEIQRRPDGNPLAGSTKSYAIITVKPTRRMPSRVEPEPEPSNVNKHHGRGPRPRPEPEPEPVDHHQRKRKPAQHDGGRKPPGHAHHVHVPQNIQPLASINYPARERPAGLGVKPSQRPQKERPPIDQARQILSGLPVELLSNYDIDIKALGTHPLLPNGGPIDLAQLHLLPGLGEALADLAGPTKRPFGLPSELSPGAHSKQRGPTRGTTRKPAGSPPTPKYRPPPAMHHQHLHQLPSLQQQAAQPALIQLQPQIELLPQLNFAQHFLQQAPQLPPTGIPLPRPTHVPTSSGLGLSNGIQYQYQTENVQFHHQQAKPIPLAPQLHQQQQQSGATVTKNGFKPVVAGQTSQFPQVFETQQQQGSQIKPNLQGSASSRYNQYTQTNVPQSHYGVGVPSQATTQWIPSSSTTRRPTTIPGLVTKTTKSSLLIIPVPDDHPKASNLNDLIRISKDYPHLFPHGFDFSKVESVTRTQQQKSTSQGAGSSSSASQSKPVYSGQPAAAVKNETKSDYIMVVVNEELGQQDIKRVPTASATSGSTASTATTKPPTVSYTTTTSHAKTKAPVVIKLEIPEDKPELVKNIVDKVKEGLSLPTPTTPSKAPVYVSVTASVSSPSASSPTPSASSPRPSSTAGSSASSSSTSEGDNFYDNKNQNIPQSLYESIQQEIAQHLYQQHGSSGAPTSSGASTSGSSPYASSSASTPFETSTAAPTTVPPTQPPTQPPVTTVPSESTHAILEQIPYNYYWHSNANDTGAQQQQQQQQQQVAQGWPYMQGSWYGNPYAPYYPQPVYVPSPTAPVVGNQTGQQQFFSYGYNPYPQPQWPASNYSAAYGPNWYEWPYVQPSGSAPLPVHDATVHANSSSATTAGQKLSSFFITTTVTTVEPSTEAPATTARPRYQYDRTTRRTPITFSTWTTPPTTTAESVTEAFDLLRKGQQASNGDAPQIQVYIVQGPNGPQVQTKTVNSKEGQKQPHVQVYVIDENNKEKQTTYAVRTTTSAPEAKPAHNAYYSYNHYQTDESQISSKKTSSKQQPQYEHVLPTVKQQSSSGKQTASGSENIQSLYSSIQAHPGLKNFTDGSVPESACTRPGLFQHPNDCNKFYECYYDRVVNKYALHLFECPVKLAFDSRIVGCSGPTDPTVCIQY